MAVGLIYRQYDYRRNDGGVVIELSALNTEDWPRSVWLVREEIDILESAIDLYNLSVQFEAINGMFFYETATHFSHILNRMQAERRIDQWQVICDRRNNTPDMADRGIWGLQILVGLGIGIGTGSVELVFPYDCKKLEKPVKENVTGIWKPY